MFLQWGQISHKRKTAQTYAMGEVGRYNTRLGVKMKATRS